MKLKVYFDKLKRLRLSRYIFLLVFYLLLAVIFSYPLINNINYKIPNGYLVYKNPIVWGDHLQTYSKALEHKYNLEHFFNDLYHKEYCFPKEIVKCKLSLNEKINNVIFSPYWLVTILSYFVPSIVAYNLNIIFSFVSTGFASFWLAKHFIKFKSKLENRYSNIIEFFIALYASMFCVLAHKRMIYLFAGQKIGYLLFLAVVLILYIEKYIKNSTKKYITIIAVLLFILNMTEQFLLFYGLWYLALRICWYEIIERKFVMIMQFNFKYVLRYTWIPLIVLCLFIVSNLSKLGEINSSVVGSGRELEIIHFNSAIISNLWAQKYTGFETNIYLGFGNIVLVMSLFYVSYIFISRKKVSPIIFFLLFALLMVIVSLGLNTRIYSFLYEYVPTFKFSRTPTKSLFYILPIITILTAIIFSKVTSLLFKKYPQNIKFLVYGYIFLVITSIYVTYSKIPISVVNIPNRADHDIPEYSKVLFLPLNRPIDPFGAIYEYYLTTNNFLALNGYTPFPKIAQEEFVEKYGNYLNIGDINMDLINKLKADYGIEYIIISKKYFSSSRIPVPHLEGLSNDYNTTVNALNKLGVGKINENEEWIIYRI